MRIRSHKPVRSRCRSKRHSCSSCSGRTACPAGKTSFCRSSCHSRYRSRCRNLQLRSHKPELRNRKLVRSSYRSCCDPCGRTASTAIHRSRLTCYHSRYHSRCRNKELRNRKPVLHIHKLVRSKRVLHIHKPELRIHKLVRSKRVLHIHKPVLRIHKLVHSKKAHRNSSCHSNSSHHI